MIEIVPAYDRIDEFYELVKYTDMILKEDPEVGKTLSSQKFSLKCIISVKNMVIQTEKCILH